MPFQVKAKLVAFMGGTEKYPCHFCHEIGDEVIFNGESYIGRLCPDVWPLLTPKVAALHAAGPRYVIPEFYYPFHYCSASRRDLDRKKYDGLGFQNVLETIVPPPHDMANLVPPNAFKWPPHPELTVLKDIRIYSYIGSHACNQPLHQRLYEGCPQKDRLDLIHNHGFKASENGLPVFGT